MPDNEKIIEAKILPILNVLDKIHDPYEGEDLSGHDLVAEHIQGIFSMHEFVFIIIDGAAFALRWLISDLALLS